MRVVVAMSGGVDSSVAASLLVDQGHDVVGLSMQLYDQTATEAPGPGATSFGSCCSLDDLHDARRVASAIQIPHYVLNLEREFQERVISNFVEEYAAGRTPLPCTHCNSDLKFATLAERAAGLGAALVATGHYAQVAYDAAMQRYVLKRGVDPSKDQAYFLFSLTQEQLGQALFPVGALAKSDVRAYARARNLPVADKPDSQEICFIPDDDYRSFVSRRLTDTPAGPIVDEQGRQIGGHEGIHRFTIGQRKGLGLGDVAGGSPLYVLGLRPTERTVVVGPRQSLERVVLTASNVNWILPKPNGPLRVTAQIRHRHAAAPATLVAMEGATATVTFDRPQMAVTPGQAVVFYSEDVVLGGGWID
jgi:tRNA-specific 2-thiouridylase